MGNCSSVFLLGNSNSGRQPFAVETTWAAPLLFILEQGFAKTFMVLCAAAVAEM
jgi:hypothetical protein